MNYLYFAPIFVVDSLGLSPYVAQVVVACSELFAYPLSVLFIKKMPRVKSGVYCFIISSIATGVLIFIEKP